MALGFRFFPLSRLFEQVVSVMKILHVLIGLVLVGMPMMLFINVKD
jgi:hypothetical protein